MHVFEIMDAEGHVQTVQPQHCDESGTCITVDGANYTFFGAHDDAHAYCLPHVPLTPESMMHVALPLTLGGGMLLPAPVLWVSETGIERHYKKRVALEDGLEEIAIDDGIETASLDDEMDAGIYQPDEEDSDDGEESEGEDDDDEDMTEAPVVPPLPRLQPEKATQNVASWSAESRNVPA